MDAAIDDVMGSLYESPGQKPKKEALNLRVPDSLRAMLNDTVKLWKMYAEARGEDADAIDLSFVCVRLLKVGSEQAFGEVGVKITDGEAGHMRRPQTSADKDEAGRPLSTVTSADEWKLVAKAIRNIVNK